MFIYLHSSHILYSFSIFFFLKSGVDKRNNAIILQWNRVRTSTEMNTTVWCLISNNKIHSFTHSFARSLSLDAFKCLFGRRVLMFVDITTGCTILYIYIQIKHMWWMHAISISLCSLCSMLLLLLLFASSKNCSFFYCNFHASISDKRCVHAC